MELGRPSNNIGNRYRKLIKTYSTTTGMQLCVLVIGLLFLVPFLVLNPSFPEVIQSFVLCDFFCLLSIISHFLGENGVVVTPLNVHSYLPIEQERKLAVALAPVTSSTHANTGDNEGNTGENNDGSAALAVSEEEFLEAATAGKCMCTLLLVRMHLALSVCVLRD